MLNQQIDEAMMKSSTQYENKLPIQMHMGVVVLNYLKFVKKYTVIFWLWNQGNYQLKEMILWRELFFEWNYSLKGIILWRESFFEGIKQ